MTVAGPIRPLVWNIQPLIEISSFVHSGFPKLSTVEVMASRPEQETAERIQAGLKELERLAAMPPGDGSPSTPWRDFERFWRKAKEISELFRLSPMAAQDRVRLWDQHQTLCDKVASIRARERRMRQAASRETREEILSKLDEAGRAAPDQTRTVLDDLLDALKNRFLIRQDRDQCWTAWHEANRALRIRQSAEKHSLAEGRHAESRRRSEERLDFLNDVLERKKRARERVAREIEGLRHSIKTSWNMQWANRAKGWLAEKEAKAKVLDADVESIQQQIAHLRNPLNR
jgi:hypothetical protein